MKKLFSFCLAAALPTLFLHSVEASTTNTNSVVRFRFTYGSTLFGDVKVELFNNDKPVTVSNFLSYVQSGRYNKSVLHRLLPGFVVQGGAVTVGNPYSESPLQSMTLIDTFPPITNEFGVGPEISNTFGTIAMAKLPDDPDSATSSWFFNLGNNSTNLDVQNGGFTVFGRVIGGSNVLSYLNTLNKTDPRGIIDTTGFFYFFNCPPISLFPGGEPTGFSDLPVGFFGLDCVKYRDLYQVSISMISGPDVLAPTAVINTPAANATVTAPDLTVTGTASDNEGVTSVEVFLNDDRSQVATGTNSWTTTFTNIPPGTNMISVVATDKSGNQSKTVYRSIFRSVRVPLTLVKTGNGAGTITGPTNGQMLEIGRGYTLTAKAATGSLFAGWTGSVTTFSPALSFLMESNTAFTGRFILNPYTPVKGTYTGLFSETNGPQHGLAGYLTLTLVDRGTYSGKLTIDGKVVPISGGFSFEGVANKLIVRSGSNDLVARFELDLSGESGQMVGTLRMGTTRTANLVADLATFKSTTNAAPQAGNYTLVIPGSDGSTDEPAGDSFGTVKVDANGKVTFVGTMADGTKAVQKSVLSRTGRWPFFVPLYTGKGFAFGYLQFEADDEDTDIDGDVIWAKAMGAGGVYYPNGFRKEDSVVGSKFTKPATSTTRVVDIPTGVVAFAGGNLDADFSSAVTMDVSSKVTDQGGNGVVLKISKGNGLMNGTANPLNQFTLVKFKGVVLQKQKAAAGFFLGTDQSGSVTFTATP